jgi:hypothetical protein
MRFRLVQELAADGFDVAVTCRVLSVSRSGYYDWLHRPPSDRDLEDAYLANTIADIHADSRRSYGAPRVHAELRLGMGVRVGRKRVARLLRLLDRAGISHRAKRYRRPAAAVHEDLVKRRFVADGPDRLWCTDITEHPTRGGKVYCCAVLDVFSRTVVGWSIADHMRSDLVVDALQMATWRRRPEGTIVHSDRGSQYTSWVFGHRLRDAGLLGSMGRGLVQPAPATHLAGDAQPGRVRDPSHCHPTGGMITTPTVSGEPGQAPCTFGPLTLTTSRTSVS